MGYKEALESAGATVHRFGEFGSYQGDWWANVTYKGITGWIHGYYGSCSGCDAFEAEFGWKDRGQCSEHAYTERPYDCKDCDEASKKYQERLAAFGAEYLDNIITTEQALAKASEDSDWDCEAEKMVKFIRDTNQ